MCAFFLAMSDEQGIELVVYGRYSVRADAGLLRRALSNLVANALRHTPRGRRVTLDAKVTGKQEVEITVSDTACGVAPDDLPRVLERFYRADSARVRRGQGMGLDLAIVQSIMHLHGGKMSI